MTNHSTAAHPIGHVARFASVRALERGIEAIENHMVPDLAVAARVFTDSVAIESLERCYSLVRELSDLLSDSVEREKKRLGVDVESYDCGGDERKPELQVVDLGSFSADELPEALRSVLKQIAGETEEDPQ